MNTISVKRIYEPSSDDDGYRVLVDRLWPRGISKEKANTDEWAKSIAPSTELRKEFHQDPSQIDEFRRKYIHELENNEYSSEFADHIGKKLDQANVTLLYAAKSETINHAIVLREWLIAWIQQHI